MSTIIEVFISFFLLLRLLKIKNKPEITDDLILNIIKGNLGNGKARKEKLESMGFSSDEIKKIQKMVNTKLKEGEKS